MKKIRNSILFFSLVLMLSIILSSLAIAIANQIDNEIIIYLDPGHGGFDGGATSKDSQVIEKDLNLKVCNYLKSYLEKTNFKVIMTRDIDEALSNNKRDDILKRVDLINNSKCELYISIHTNSYTSSMIKGAQVFYNGSVKYNKQFAASIMEHIKLIDQTNKRDIKEITGKYLLDHITKTGCLVEIGFLTNPEELTKLQNDEYLENMALMIYLGILDYLEVKNYGTINY